MAAQNPPSRSSSQIRGRDWRARDIGIEPTEERLSRLVCPFTTNPEPTPTVPSEYAQNVQHILNTTEADSVPWAGYYASYRGIRVAVTNAFGVWFEIQRTFGSWSAIRLARLSLQLRNWPMPGIDMAALEASGEPIEAHVRRAPSRATTQPDDDHPERPTNPRSSQTQRGRGGRPPRGTGDDPYGVRDLDDDDRDNKPRRLEGVVPTKFDGNRSKTLPFLAEFKRFMRINRDADIAKDPFKKCNYFLAFFTGPDTEGWVDQQDDWLIKVDRDPSILPWRMDEWDVMEQEFKKAFVDYAEHEKANDDLRKLKMKDGNVDAYIARFSQLAHRGGHNVNEPELLRLFAIGLPAPQANACIDQQDPETFEEWTHAAQRNQKVWLKNRASKGSLDRPRVSETPNDQIIPSVDSNGETKTAEDKIALIKNKTPPATLTQWTPAPPCERQ
jgi:hypothetical protein